MNDDLGIRAEADRDFIDVSGGFAASLPSPPPNSGTDDAYGTSSNPRVSEGSAVAANVKPPCVDMVITDGRVKRTISVCEGALNLGGTERTPWLEREEIVEALTAAEGTPPGEPVIVTAQDLQSLLVESGGLIVQPDQPWVLVNIDTIVMTGAAEQLLQTTVLGIPVQVRVRPVEFAWDFGDGSPVVVGTDPGAPWPDYTVAHTYVRPGEVRISLTTQWEGEFQVDGSPDWIPVAGRAVTQEVSHPIEVVTATPRLVVPGG